MYSRCIELFLFFILAVCFGLFTIFSSRRTHNEASLKRRLCVVCIKIFLVEEKFYLLPRKSNENKQQKVKKLSLIMAENAIPAAVSEELYTTQDLLSEDPVAATKTLTEVHHELDVDEDRDVVEDETYETDEELLAESKNVKPLEENNEQAGDEGLEPMEEGLESSTETGEICSVFKGLIMV